MRRANVVHRRGAPNDDRSVMFVTTLLLLGRYRARSRGRAGSSRPGKVSNAASWARRGSQRLLADARTVVRSFRVEGSCDDRRRVRAPGGNAAREVVRNVAAVAPRFPRGDRRRVTMLRTLFPFCCPLLLRSVAREEEDERELIAGLKEASPRTADSSSARDRAAGLPGSSREDRRTRYRSVVTRACSAGPRREMHEGQPRGDNEERERVRGRRRPIVRLHHRGERRAGLPARAWSVAGVQRECPGCTRPCTCRPCTPAGMYTPVHPRVHTAFGGTHVRHRVRRRRGGVREHVSGLRSRLRAR